MKGFSMRKIAIALVAATALFAADSAYKYELTPTIGGVHPEGNLGVNEQSAIGLRIGRNLENFFLDHVELGLSHTNKIREYGVDGKATRYFVNAIKDFGLTEKLSLYGLLGAGYEDVSRKFVKNDDGGFGQYGLGLRYQITDNFALRAEAVKNLLIAQYGISKDRIDAAGQGVGDLFLEPEWNSVAICTIVD